MLKDAVYVAVVAAALFLSFLLFIVVAADPKLGTHAANHNGLALASLTLAAVAWAGAAAINRWRKRS